MPAAVPCTLAITGTSQSRIALTVRIAPRSIIRRRSPITRSGASAGRSDSIAGAPPLRSAPVQKKRPVAWSTTQRMARSSSARANHSPIFTRCVAGERVAGLGPVDGDGADAVGDLEADAVEVLGEAHACSCSTAPGAPGGRIVYSILL